jgi:hypothetical protein
MAEITSSGFANRNIIEYLTSDKGIKHYRCNTLQNPLAYYAGGKLSPVSIVDVADTFSSKSEGIYLREKNIVSVGLKKADDAYKFIGFRPDEDQGGSEQLEFSLESIEINGKAQTIDLHSKIPISPIAYDIGPVIVQSRRQGTRICLPLTNADDGFKFSLRMYLTGLTVQYYAHLDEYWIFNEEGKYRFRLRRPILLDPSTGEPLLKEDETGRYEGLVKHSLIEVGKGEYLYVKEPTEAFGKAKLPQSFMVDADTVYSSTADGYVTALNAAWATVRSAETGNSNNSNAAYYNNVHRVLQTSGNYYITRAFFYYDVSALSGSATAVLQYIYGYSTQDSGVTAQKGTQGDTLANADYDSFSGSSYGSVSAWSSSSYNVTTFNATGRSDVQSAFGGVAKVCAREKPHDYDDSAPGNGETYANGCYFADNSGTDKDPYLYITTGPALPAFVPKIIMVM